MESLFPIIIIIVVVMIIRSAAKNAKPSSPSRNPNGGGQSLGDILQQAVRSTSNEKWMAAAGALKGRYIRPAAGKSPAIEGEYNGLKYKVFLVHPNARNVSCRIHFPQNIDKDLLIVHERNDFVSKFFKQHTPPFRGTGFYPKHLGGSAADEQWFRQYLAKNDRVNLINGMTHYLLSFQITDTGISAVFESDLNFPDVPLVKVLLNDAELLLDTSDGAHIQMAPESEPVPEICIPDEQVTPDDVVIVSPLPPPEVLTQEVAPAPIPVPPEPEETAAPEPAPSPVPPMPEVAAPKPVTAAPMPEVSRPKPVFSAAPAMKSFPSTPATPEMTTAGLPLEQQAFCDTLFKNTIMGKTEKALFAAAVGQSVEWQGTLLSSYDFTFDFAFGNKKGVKASFLLCEVAGSGSLKQKVKVHVSFPAELSNDLKQKRDQQLKFRGTLLKMESFSREIYLDNGELL